MNTTVGPFTIHKLNVREGLRLVSLAADKDGAFQTELLLACVKRDGADVAESDFADFMPHLKELVEAAMALNGFRNGADE